MGYMANIKADTTADRLKWVVVINPGKSDESVVAEFRSFIDAKKFAPSYQRSCDILRRNEAGELTTEF